MPPSRAMLRLVPPEETPSDDALMRQVSGGDSVAFHELVERHLKAVTRFCARAGSPDAADDLAQETFTRLWRARSRWKPSAAFAQYLYSLALNVCRNHHRGLRRRLSAFSLLSKESPVSGALVDGLLEDRETWGAVQAAVAELPEAQREAIVARYSAGLDGDELGEVLGCNASTARSRIFFGLKRLRDLLGARS